VPVHLDSSGAPLLASVMQPERRRNGNHPAPGAHGPQGPGDRQGHRDHQDPYGRDSGPHHAGYRPLIRSLNRFHANRDWSMARKSRQTGKAAARAASRVLRGNYSAAAKKAAASALSQTPKRAKRTR